MDARYQEFCITDPVFYDSPGQAGIAQGCFMTGRAPPHGWNIFTHDNWVILSPPGIGIAMQGWKIHVSATPSNAREILDAVWAFCVKNKIHFKFLDGHIALLLRNAKYADRAGSGKFITLYPAENELEGCLRELGAELRGQCGPYVLSDLRWEEGPLYVRYGSFLDQRALRNGESVSVMKDPDGRLVVDERKPVFDPPSWVALPGFLSAAIADSKHGAKGASPEDFPYDIDSPLHFSNGGGIYLATDKRTQRRVVLREARPYAGLDMAGNDAIQRLEREATFLARVGGLNVAPELYAKFSYWEHQFLVEEYIQGETLGRHFAKRFPLVRANATEQDIEEYSSWATDILQKILVSLKKLHEEGVVFGDLHPHNILLQDDGQVRFIDFEMASDAADPAATAMGAPGYVAVDGRRGVDADLYAWACLCISLFLPLSALFPLSAGKPREIVKAICKRFPLPEAYFEEIESQLRPKIRPRSDQVFSEESAALVAGMDESRIDLSELKSSIVKSIIASATPERPDRLFPGDIGQFSYGGHGVAYGAAGVLLGLAQADAGRFEDYEDWLVDRTMIDRIGFYDGAHGVAYALERLGRTSDAMRLLERVEKHPLQNMSLALFDGLPGIGLNFLHFAESAGDNSYLSLALSLADRLASLANESAEGPAGLMKGASGHALFYIRLYERTGDSRLLDLAETSIQRDLDRCQHMPDGSLQLDDRWRVLPYVASGSAGIGLVICEFLNHREHDQFAKSLRMIANSAVAEFVVQSGLFNGRAGLLYFLLHFCAHGRTGSDEFRPVIERHLRRLAWHALPFQGNIAFPGDQLQRLSMDLATGSTGVLLAINAGLGRYLSPILPFFTANESCEIPRH